MTQQFPWLNFVQICSLSREVQIWVVKDIESKVSNTLFRSWHRNKTEFTCRTKKVILRSTDLVSSKCYVLIHLTINLSQFFVSNIVGYDYKDNFPIFKLVETYIKF